jgi:putative SOS response-associated peptidase YedK
MCGRFVRTSPEEVICETFGVKSAAAVDLRPRYNIAPGESVAAIVRDREGKRLGMLRWAATSINARSETASRRFRESFLKRRCLIVADGFYEWRQVGRTKMPHFFTLESRRPFAFAALWNRTGPSRVPACTILTCRPNELVARVHDRMPVILGQEGSERWLDPGAADPEDLQSLLEPYPADQMACHPVSTLVNSARNDSPECIQPVVEGTLRLVDKPD